MHKAPIAKDNMNCDKCNIYMSCVSTHDLSIYFPDIEHYCPNGSDILYMWGPWPNGQFHGDVAHKMTMIKGQRVMEMRIYKRDCKPNLSRKAFYHNVWIITSYIIIAIFNSIIASVFLQPIIGCNTNTTYYSELLYYIILNFRIFHMS